MRHPKQRYRDLCQRAHGEASCLVAAVMKTKIRVVLADDHPVVRDGLAAMVNQQADMEVVAP